ncbi:MAG: class I SAM-dependent methyltransferase [Candidatus Omnitrophica bacterium]|nr:class I SAM-dependent methyltransferase [Candidatus Omnitrophota bacterium]
MRASLVSIPCDLCGGDRTEALFQDEGFQYVRCTSCGLVYLNPRPTEEMLKAWYQSHGAASGEPFLQKRQEGYYTRYLENEEGYLLEGKRFLRQITDAGLMQGRVLDVGCAAGFYLSIFKKAGWESYGLELSDVFIRYACDTLHLNVQKGSLGEVTFQENFFGAVLMIDTLSHFTSPQGTLREAFRILKKGGFLLLRTGNKGSLSGKKSGERWGENWGAPEHLYHFSEKTLKALLEKTGFSIEHFQSYANVANLISPATLHLPDAVYRFHKVLRRPYRFLRNVLTVTLGRTLRHTPLSGTITVLATKPGRE